MASILRKPWKEQKSRPKSSIISYERDKRIDDIERQERLKRKEAQNEIKQAKREYIKKIKAEKEEKKKRLGKKARR